MKLTRLVPRAALCGLLPALCVTAALSTEPPPSPAAPPAAAPDAATIERVRGEAQVMHDIYAATLDVMHERYFHGERAMVPARAMEDIFEDIKHASKREARWISVNMSAMSVDHEPETEFEKRAARELAAGKVTMIESIEGDTYRRAGAITLSAGCVSCHARSLGVPIKGGRLAGLVISVPLKGTPEKAGELRRTAFPGRRVAGKEARPTAIVWTPRPHVKARSRRQ